MNCHVSVLNMEKECVTKRKLIKISPIVKRKGRIKIGETKSILSNNIELKTFWRKVSHNFILFLTFCVIISTAFVSQALSDSLKISNQSESRNSEENLISSSQVVNNLEQVFDHQPDSNRSKISAHSDEESMKFPLYMRIIATFVCLLIFTVGVCGNLLVPIVVVKTKYLKNSTNLFLINLAVADLLVLIICEPTVLIELHSRPETWLLGEPMCKISNFVEMSAANASIFTILAISFERYYAICKPLKAGYKCTRLRATIIICFIWLLSFILTSPILIMAKSSKTIYIDGSLVDNCILETDSYWHRMYVFVSMFAFFCLPLAVLILVYWLISRRLIRENLAIATSAKTSLATTDENFKNNRHQLSACRSLGYSLKGKGSRGLKKAASFKHSISTFLTQPRYDDNKQTTTTTTTTRTDLTVIDEFEKGGQSSVSMKRSRRLIGGKSQSLDHHLTAEVGFNQLLCEKNKFNNCQQAYDSRSAHASDSKHSNIKKAFHNSNGINLDDNEQTDHKGINHNEAPRKTSSKQQPNLLKLIKYSSSGSLHRLVYQLFCFERVTHRSLPARDERLNHKDDFVSSESFRRSHEIDNLDRSKEAIDRNTGFHINSNQSPEQNVPFLASVDTECSASVSAETSSPTKYNLNNVHSKEEQTNNRGVKSNIFGNTARNLINGARGTFRFNKCPRQTSVASSISISIPTQTNSTDLPSEIGSVDLMPNVDIPMMRNSQDQKACDFSSNSLVEQKWRQSQTKFDHHYSIASNNSSHKDDLHEKEHSSSSSSLVQQHQQQLVHSSNRKVINQSVFDKSLGKVRSNHLLMTTGTAVPDSRIDEESLVNNFTNYAAKGIASSQISSNCDSMSNNSGRDNFHNDYNTDIVRKISTQKSKFDSLNSSSISKDKNKGSEQTISDKFFDKQNSSLNSNQSNYHHHHHSRFNFSKIPYWGKRKSDPVICNHKQFKSNKQAQQSTKLLVVQDISKKQQMDSRRQVVIMLAFVVAAFFLLLFPYRVFTIWLLSSTEDQVQSLGMETYYNLTYFCRILIYLHSAINPIAYNLISIKFRRAFMSILLCHGSSERRNFTTKTKIEHKLTNSNIGQKKSIIPKNSTSAKMIEF